MMKFIRHMPEVNIEIGDFLCFSMENVVYLLQLGLTLIHLRMYYLVYYFIMIQIIYKLIRMMTLINIKFFCYLISWHIFIPLLIFICIIRRFLTFWSSEFLNVFILLKNFLNQSFLMSQCPLVKPIRSQHLINSSLNSGCLHQIFIIEEVSRIRLNNQFLWRGGVLLHLQNIIF